MHRFFLSPELAHGELLTLSAEDSHHAANVLRVRPGEAASVLDGAGTEYCGVFQQVSKRAVTVSVQQRLRAAPRPVELRLVVALLKGRAWDWVLEKATELGAAEIQPLAAERSIVHVTPEVEQSKLAGWRATMIAAAKQCGTPWLPRLPAPVTPAEWCQRGVGDAAGSELRLVASLEPGARSLRRLVRETVFPAGASPRSQASAPSAVSVVVGPEGDFTPGEYAGFRAAGVHPFTLGPLVLRADTAAVAALAVAAAELAAD